MQVTECLVCGANHWKPLYDQLLLKCANCGFITANLEVDQAQLDEVYTENYFKGEEYLDYLEDQEVQRLNFRDRIKEFEKVIGNSAPKNILEIGCAYGLFGDEARRQWPSAQYTGFDVVEEAIDHAKRQLGLDARNKDYLSEKLPQKHDAVFMWDVIEHLQHPDKFLAKVSDEMEPDGTLCITTGDIGALVPKLQGRKWRMIHPPSHLHYFSKKTIEKLLNAHGFELIRCSYPSISRSVRLIFFGLFMLNRNAPKWVSKLHNTIPSRWRVGINTFDIMFVIAKKKS
jgi:2-polyprenyl-3-methyl-5-hydroxy-6-metoxy-1,4-benzoquinol methylase